MADVTRIDRRPFDPTVAEPQAAAVPEVIEVLEDALAEARAGRVTAVALAIVRPEGGTCDQWGMQSGRVHELMASITYLQHRYTADVLSESEQEPGPA